MTDELKAIKQEPNPALVERLERILKQAKSGEIKGILYAVVFNDEQTEHSWLIPNRSSWQIPALIGELYLTMTDMANNRNGIDSRNIDESH